MKKFFVRAALLVAATSVSIFGIAVSPATAASVTSPSVSSSGLIQGQTNSNPLVITMTATTSGAARAVNVTIPTGWSWAQTLVGNTSCTPPSAYAAVSGFTPTYCRYGTGTVSLSQDLYFAENMGSFFAAGDTVTITLAPGTLNVGAGTDFILSFADGPTVVDTSTVAVNASPSSSVVTFDANGGAGTTSSQTASIATALSANGFTRSGYTFSGWNTASNGSGTAYADGASFPFTSSTTLYAQWTANLANTGINSVTATSLLAGGLSLAAIGVAMFIFARRKSNN